ncbi:F-box domain-containing protein [Artemisia annua]|uniref:F-box domain-containing protein n=1 Tax=Artemisia annua TaxID=35608 RepID=A0A2U1LBD9_ARTAN|nr:F-box domain-containing protein [Artemisia annua]
MDRYRPWSDLPIELLSPIADQLALIELLSFHGTCKGFRSASTTASAKNGKPNANEPSASKEGLNGAASQPNVSSKVIMNDSTKITKENGYFKDDINLGQLWSTIKKLSEEEKVLDLNSTNDLDGGLESSNSMPITSEVLTTTQSVPTVLTASKNESLWVQFSKNREASTSKNQLSMSITDESDDDETQNPPEHVRLRRPSDRIIQRKLAKQLNGQGSTPNTTLDVDQACRMDIYTARLHDGATVAVADMVENGRWKWPNSWLTLFPVLNSIEVPALQNSEKDYTMWKCNDGRTKHYVTKQVWQD